MSVRSSYNKWSEQYDSNENRTRDLEAVALREMLASKHFGHILEIGCGTGKNTQWLKDRCDHLTAVDLSEGMLAIAKEKIRDPHVTFKQVDILGDWDFIEKPADLVTFSLVLEHIDDLSPIFLKCSSVIADEGSLYIGELHPFKQYAGSRARFETAGGTEILTCFTHHLSDFYNSASRAGFCVSDIREFFDDNEESSLPRLLCMTFTKPSQ